MRIIIEAISREHDRKAFDCGVAELNRFLQQQARQKAARHLAKTYVACLDVAPTMVAGFHTLTGYSVMIPPDHKDYRNHPHPLFAVKLARLAVDVRHQGKKIGERLLVDAIWRTVEVARQIASIGLFVDPMTPDIIPFYQQYGFLAVDPKHPSCLDLWLPMKTCVAVVAQVGRT